MVRVRAAATWDVVVFVVCIGASKVSVVCPIDDHIITVIIAVAIVVYAAMEPVAGDRSGCRGWRVPCQSEVQRVRIRITTVIRWVNFKVLGAGISFGPRLSEPIEESLRTRQPCPRTLREVLQILLS